MTKDDFIKTVTTQVQEYIDNFDRFDNDPQLRVNPELLFTDIVNGSDRLNGIGYSDEAVEDAAYAQGDETMSSSDYQASQDPDFFPVKELLKPVSSNKSEPDIEKIKIIAANYFK